MKVTQAHRKLENALTLRFKKAKSKHQGKTVRKFLCQQSQLITPHGLPTQAIFKAVLKGKTPPLFKQILPSSDFLQIHLVRL
ncbi:hypothetical protein [Pontibacter litorisediminis]|uniref:hypothetical protein n=1 Tax=Pontibacter litorisediminis TaxID=1846260 RepID=UPI0023EC5A37|nr:hypothetical protein [Pontibacter litorisediminis]